jgi:hypothetical protein
MLKYDIKIAIVYQSSITFNINIYLMKVLLIISIFILFTCQLIASNPNNPFNEIRGSFNKTTTAKNVAKSAFGFGFGIYSASKNKKHFSTTIGFEFNLSRQTKSQETNSHFSSSNNISSSIHSISMPVTQRFLFGKTKQLFLELGTYVDCNFYSQKKGYESGISPITLVSYQNVPFTNKNFAKVFSVGPSIGTGIIIPLKKNEILLSTDYKLGLTQLVGEGYYSNYYNRYFRFNVGLKF